MEGGRSELTRTNSVSSAVTVADSKDFPNHDLNEILGKSSDFWTDEKHNLYLESLEASFVKQLHRSKGLYALHSEKHVRGPYSSRKLPAKAHNLPAQFMIPQDGCLEKRKRDNNEHLLSSTADSRAAQTYPWTHHLTYAGDHCPFDQEHSSLHSDGIYLRGSHDSASCSEQYPGGSICHQNLVCSITEVSDQNFVDEDHAEKSRCAPRGRRLKTVEIDASSNDQVMPFGKFSTADISIFNNTTCAESKEYQELLSEYPDSFSRPKSDLHYFLRGS